MKTIEATPYQTIEAIIRKHEDLAQFYIEKASAAALEAGKTTPHESAQQSAAAHGFFSEATSQTKKAEGLRGFMAARRAEATRPAIEKVKA